MVTSTHPSFWMTELPENPHFTSNNEIITCYQSACLAVKGFKQVFFWPCHNFSVFCYTAPNSLKHLAGIKFKINVYLQKINKVDEGKKKKDVQKYNNKTVIAFIGFSDLQFPNICAACTHCPHRKRLSYWQSVCPSLGPFHTSGIPGLQHTINMDGRDEFTEDSECCSNNSQEVQEQDSISGTGRRDGSKKELGRLCRMSSDWGVLVRVSPALCSVVCLFVLIGLCLPP